MNAPIAARYALRSLRRNGRRSLLSILGVAFGVGMGLIAISFVQGLGTLTVNAAAGGGMGHLRVVPATWQERRDDALRLEGGEDMLRAIREAPGVRAATPRARVGAILGLGTRSSHVNLTGVDSSTEQEALRYVSRLAEGRYLEPGERGAVVLGRSIVRRLGAQLDDELVATALDREGQMQSVLLTIVGIAETGSRDVDDSIAQVALEEVSALSGRPGYGEITILIDEPSAVDALREELAPLVRSPDVLLTWREVAPELYQNQQSKSAFYDLAVFVVLLVVLLGVASAQLTSVLERRKEFAVLAAVGMRGAQLVRVVLIEGALLGLAATLGALAWAGPLTWKLATDGIDISSVLQGDEAMSFGGVLIETMFYPETGPWIVPAATALALTATVLASLYPAWFAARTDPALALRVDR
ncbi:MAG: ABC transporter permease [Sandaracinaceae bacterium]